MFLLSSIYVRPQNFGEVSPQAHASEPLTHARLCVEGRERRGLQEKNWDGDGEAGRDSVYRISIPSSSYQFESISLVMATGCKRSVPHRRGND
jgi:hypothetical protein